MSEKPHYYEHRRRLRERFLRSGAQGMHDYELIELLLTYAIPRRDVKPIAKNLIERFGGLTGVLDAPHAELETVDGVGSISATLICLVKELCGQYLAYQMKESSAITSPDAVLKFAHVRLSGLPYEAFMVIFLTAKNEVIDYEIIHEGSIDRAYVYPRRIIESALKHHAVNLVLVHNHPSGHPNPSGEDRRLTETISKAAQTVDMRVIDHLIIGKRGYFSFAERGLI